MINAGYAGALPLHLRRDGQAGLVPVRRAGQARPAHRAEERFAFDDGVYGSETAMAPRVGSTGEDDGYLVTLTTDMNADASYCLVFDAARVADGPVCKLALPERISSGTHSTWAAGSELRRWHEHRRRGRRDRPVGGSSPAPNAVGRMLGLLGDEWTLLVIQQALLGATRYGEFTARLPISQFGARHAACGR